MDEILKLIDSYWKFDNNQQPMSSWCDKQDLLKAVEEALKNSPNPVLCDENCIKKCSCGRKLHPTFYCNICDNDE